MQTLLKHSYVTPPQDGRWRLRVHVVGTIFHAPPYAIAHVHNLIADFNASRVTLDHEPTEDEAREIGRARTAELQREIDSYLHSISPEYYAPVELHSVEVQPLTCPRCGGDALEQARTWDEMFCKECGVRVAFDRLNGWIVP
jgi:ribosomal protein S27AE